MGSSEQAKIAELRAAVRQLSTLAEISVQLNATLDIDQLLQYIIQEARQLLDCEGASILLHDPQKGDLFFAAASGLTSAQLKNARVPLQGSLAGKIFQSGRVMILHHPDENPDHYNAIARKYKFTVHSLLGVPLSIRGEPIGVLEAINKRTGEFSEQDGGLLSIMASQAAVAIQNARMVQALQKAYADLQETDRLKGTFLALASHELRTPLGRIIGYASFLEEETSGETAEFARQILRAAAQMEVIIKDMTSLTLLRQGGVEADITPQPLAPLVKAVLAELQTELQAKKHQLTLNLAPDLRYVYCDPDRFKRALGDLLHNAIRFTPEGGHIEIGARAEDAARALLWVRDDGIGIAAQHLEKIFTEFYQVENHLTRRHGGLGVGLSIARALIRAQQGEVWAESPGPGQGATFYVRLRRPAQTG